MLCTLSYVSLCFSLYLREDLQLLPVSLSLSSHLFLYDYSHAGYEYEHVPPLHTYPESVSTIRVVSQDGGAL